ncbi:MAG: phosphoenolpyruvate--protein phosphotransferase [Planctomycetota bacterium]|nr:phosphoenolpyruvate--protein phosphotransferase [Planctomycetota bacterium]MDA1137230.1 phosphoenolpyruvate--protein phosphotransferase [Planctomycetota bacterium]
MADESQKLDVLADIGRIISQSHDLDETLQNIVQLVSDKMSADACSIYLYEDPQEELVLRATIGLDPEAVGRVRMKVTEGLTGLVVQEVKPVAVREARDHPRFKFFPVTLEDEYHSYLGVPLIERRSPVGVLAVQTSEQRDFSRDEIRMLETIASQVTGLIMTARMLAMVEERAKQFDDLDQAKVHYTDTPEDTQEIKARQEERRKPKVFHGLSGAPGFGMGLVHIHQHDFHMDAGYAELAEDTALERLRLDEAFAKAIEEVTELKGQVSLTLSEEDSAIFHGHLLMLEDKGFRHRIEDVIDDGRRAEFAVEVVAELYKDRFSSFDDAYLRERVIDVEDIEKRLLQNLLGVERLQREFEEEFIVFGDDISPSELMYLDSPKLMGIVLARGGVTGHVAILAKSLDLPVVLGVVDVLSGVSPNDFAIVDGNSGAVYINPGDDTVEEYVRLEAQYHTLVEQLKDLRDDPCQTLDGHKIMMEANIGMISEVPLCHEQGAEGIGLFRTEFPFLSRPNMPTEEEQFDILRNAIEALNGKSLTVRTLDIGGEKTPPYFSMPEERNPLLGWRSMRLTLDEPEIFQPQLRAIVRVAAKTPIRLMFPMISGVEELRAAKEALQNVIDELGLEPLIEIGIMIEVPSAVAVADRLAKEVDFFSIGTNDLIQYVLAVDRNNPKVSNRYEEFHPAVLTAIYDTIQAAHTQGIPVGVCGEMAGSPATAVVLAMMGIDRLSMAPSSIPFVKRALRGLDTSNAAKAVEHMLHLATTSEVKEYLNVIFNEWGISDLVIHPRKFKSEEN